MFKGLGQFASLMKNAHEIQGRMKEMQETLRRLKVEGSAGGGMVKIEINGQQQVLGCQIEPSVIESGDRELLEDLVVAAVNQALDKLKQATAEQMERMTGGLDIPGINDALSQLG
ncbi:MAG: YbaB/EbfC family nucleoid-associated protein [Planctomycetes bacterium]|nr:YbaB/EbfC family nucleoid-associated protein [Planctomycetota bacterium]